MTAAPTLVLGANLGNTIPQYLVAGSNNAARRPPLGNVVVRGLGAAGALPLLPLDRRRARGRGPGTGAPGSGLSFTRSSTCRWLSSRSGLLDPLARLCVKLLRAGAAVADPD